MVIDVWMQHPTLRFAQHEMLASLRRWTGDPAPNEAPEIGETVAAMDAAGVGFGLLSAWSAPHQPPLISNEEVAGWVTAHPDRFGALAAVDLAKPMEAVRDLRRCVGELGFRGLRVVPWLWELAPTDRRLYPLYAACVELGVPFFTQVGHTGPLRPSETGRPIPYIDQVALDFPELVIVGGHIGYPWTEEMVAVCRKHENVYIDTSAYTARRFPPALVEYMRGRGGRRKVLFGTNYPMLTPDRALAGLDELELDDETRELFLAGNAQRLLGYHPGKAPFHPDARPRAGGMGVPTKPDWTKTNFGRLRDKSPRDARMQWKLARDAMGSPELGVSRFTYEPGARMPWGHRHREQEEAYVVVSGSGRAKLDDEVLDLAEWDVLRVAPAVIRSFEAGPHGLDLICIGGRKPKGGDTERFSDFWG